MPAPPLLLVISVDGLRPDHLLAADARGARIPNLRRFLTDGAHADGVPAVVLTFDPHPAKLFGRGDIKLLTLPGERARLLGDMGVDLVVTHPFNRGVADTTAFDFMTYLRTRLGVSHLLLGYDSTLGKNREGNAARLTEIGRELGYTVELVSALSDESGVNSSTEILQIGGGGKCRRGNALDGTSLRAAGNGHAR